MDQPCPVYRDRVTMNQLVVFYVKDIFHLAPDFQDPKGNSVLSNCFHRLRRMSQYVLKELPKSLYFKRLVNDGY